MPLPPRKRSDHADAVRSILSCRGLSLAQISRHSRSRFFGNPEFHIPANFYDALRHASFSPSAQQLYALSVLTGYRLADWMSVFELSFDDAAAFQAALPRYYTTELDARVYDRTEQVGWFNEPGPVTLGTTLAPLSRWLAGKTIRPLDSLSDSTIASFRYLKIGSRDAYAYPDLLPGSIVRIQGCARSDQPWTPDNSQRIWAVVCYDRLLCSEIRPLRKDRIVLCSRQLAYAPLEVKLGAETKILGFVDLEIRQVEFREDPEVEPRRNPFAHPRAKLAMRSKRIGEWLRWARLCSGFSFREASERTARVARTLKNPTYFCAPGTLSDLEARDRLPRHIHKLISLAAVYCLSIVELAEFAGFPLEKAGKDAMPARPHHIVPHRSTEVALSPFPFSGRRRRGVAGDSLFSEKGSGIHSRPAKSFGPRSVLGWQYRGIGASVSERRSFSSREPQEQVACCLSFVPGLGPAPLCAGTAGRQAFVCCLHRSKWLADGPTVHDFFWRSSSTASH